MAITMYGLDKCSTCDKARKWLDRHGVAHRFVDYREHPVAPAQLKAWAEKAGGWEKLVNRSSMTWRALPDNRKTPASDPEWLLLIREYPALVRRPLLVLEDGRVVQRFTDKQYKTLFA
ncbi:MAG: Spx/MgsR family RNA polymerase-binding regulatory protein [Rhodanobacteraceae bacterium]